MGINIDSINVTLKGKEIINDISFIINCGEVLSIIGPNGSGKSTLMKAIVGDIIPSKGSIKYTGRNLTNISIKELANIRSVMSQSPSILYDFSVMEIIEMGWFNNRINSNSENFISTLNKILLDCDLLDLIERKFNNLSGGEQRRVHFARTLVQLYDDKNSPDSKERYMFFDEPTANLDIAYEVNMLKILRKKAKEGFGIFITLHNLEMAYNISDRVGIMSKGNLVGLGSPESVYDDLLLSEVYGLPLEFDKSSQRLKYHKE